MTGLAAVLILALASGQALLSQSVSPAGQQPVPPATRNPYQKLFQTPPLPQTATKEDRESRAREQLLAAMRDRRLPARPQPKIVCGMTIIPADPSIDPHMLINPGAGADLGLPQPKPTIRSIEPPVCRPQ